MTRWQYFKSNSQALQALKVRQQVIGGIRSFFESQDFLEVETPLVVSHPGTEPYLEVFETTLKMQNLADQRGFLLTSPEFAMKKLLVAGVPKLFQICKSFRNGEGLGAFHNPEFTLLEWYRAESDYTQIMKDVQDLVVWVAKKVGKDPQVFEYQGRTYDLASDWQKLSVAEAFEKYAGVSAEVLTSDHLIEAARERGFPIADQTAWDDAFSGFFINDLEPVLANFKQPVILYNYPVQQAALARRKKDDPRFAERFEVYLGTIELANAFSELTDADEQEARFKSELALRAELGKTDYGLDQDFIEALKAGMPESGGIALGVDRLAMIMADAPRVQDVTFFPIEDVFDLK